MKVVSCMPTFFRILATEAIKLRRSSALRLVWLLPLAFVMLDLSILGRPAFGIRSVDVEEAKLLAAMPLKAVGNLWVGYFHPMLLALLPALLFRPEHRYGLWKHLHAMPVSPRTLFLAKVTTILLLSGAVLGFVTLGLWAEWSVMARINPSLRFPFPWREMGEVVGWLYLGSLPLLALYAWLSDRINSGAMAIVFGLIGLMLTVSLSGQEVYPSWRRDLIPWILPYSSVQQAIGRPEARQTMHSAGVPFHREMDMSRLAGTEVIYLPSGRKVTSVTTIPDFLLHPPPPTPPRVLAIFSLVSGGLLLGLGFADAGRKNRS